MLGRYEHFKGGEYEVIAVGTSADNHTDNGYQDDTMIIYRDKKGRVFTRHTEEFLDFEHDVVRFNLIEKLDSQLHLFIETLRMSRLEYLRMARDDARFGQGPDKRFRFLLGDKIAFACSIRVIDKKVAGRLFDWLNKWTLFGVTGWEKYRLNNEWLKV